MSKTDTIAKYKEEYLAGKPAQAAEAFESKSIDKQYSAIMTWRYRNRKKSSVSSAENAGVESIPQIFQTMRRAVATHSPRLDEAGVQRLRDEAKSFIEFLDDYSNVVRREEIASLEARQREIASRLRELKSITEPSLFDSITED